MNRPPRAWAGPLALLVLLAPTTARAQPQTLSARLKEPVAWRVYQRDGNGRADIPVVTDQKDEGRAAATVDDLTLNRSGVNVDLAAEGIRFENGTLRNVPTGGPYLLSWRLQHGPDTVLAYAPNFYVGDLWVLAGQSNMEGYGDLIDVAAPNPQVTALGMNGRWSRAEEPLHWLVDSPDPVHSGDPATREARSAEQHKARAKGAGLGLPFADAMVKATGVPVGLVIAAHGGTSMAQWDPAKKGEGGKSLYGSMARQIDLAGGKVKGVLWYQGESDANPEAVGAYPRKFAGFIAAVRDDLKQPELPFYFVQIGRFVRPGGGDPKPWNAVQEAERVLAERVPNTAVVASVDLELDDLIHVGTQGQKRLGHRLAKVALRELFGQAGATTPTFDRVNRGPGNTLVVRFKGVNVGPGAGRAVAGLKPSRHIAGFSIRKDDGGEIPLIFDAAVGSARDTVVLKLIGPPPEKASLWYGHGYDPYCNLTDSQDMAVPVFGPVPLDDLPKP